MKPRKPPSTSGRGLRPLRPIEDRFWDKVIKHDEGCWEWTGKPDRNGYGELTGGRYAERNLHRVRANRLSWEIHNGPIPEGLWVLHTCDNPPCTNPAHLYLGTVVDNVRDRTVRRRMPTQRRTHCGYGHEFTEQNTYFEKNSRRCRTCKRERAKLAKRRKTAEAKSRRVDGQPSRSAS